MLEQCAALKPRRAGQLPLERAQLHLLYWDDRGFCTTGDSAQYVCNCLERSIAVYIVAPAGQKVWSEHLVQNV